MTRREPGFFAVFEVQRREPATLRRIEGSSTYGPGGIHYGRHVRDGRVDFLLVAGHSPLDASIDAAFPHARLPKDFAFFVRIESVHDTGFLPGNKDFPAVRGVDQ